VLLIITDSQDPTVNLLEPKLSSDFIRINVDESNSWSFKYVNGVWSIHIDTKSHVIAGETCCWWWKPIFSENPDEYYRDSEVEYIVREIYSQASRLGRVVGNPPYFHQILGKMAILDAAKKFLKTPISNCSFNAEIPLIDDAIVKSLSSAQLSDENVLYTTRVDTQLLEFRGNAWFAQEFVRAESDVTIQIVGSSLYAFERPRGSDTVDWRKEQLQDVGKSVWKPIVLSENEAKSVKGFTSHIRVEWGRLDLLRNMEGDLVFLEFNANGQFAFLDLDDKYGLLTNVSTYLNQVEHPINF